MIQIGPMYFPDGEEHFQYYADNITDYQRHQRDKAFEYVTDWRMAVDVGAHVGIFSRAFAERFETVWSFEPVAETRECLRLNVPSNVVVQPYALGAAPGTRRISRTVANSGGSFLCDDPELVVPSKAVNQVDISMVTLDSFDLPHLDLIKIDVQGAEPDVVLGAQATLRRCRPVVLMEVKPVGGWEGDASGVLKAVGVLEALGYVARERVGADQIYTAG